MLNFPHQALEISLKLISCRPVSSLRCGKGNLALNKCTKLLLHCPSIFLCPYHKYFNKIRSILAKALPISSPCIVFVNKAFIFSWTSLIYKLWNINREQQAILQMCFPASRGLSRRGSSWETSASREQMCMHGVTMNACGCQSWQWQWYFLKQDQHTYLPKPRKLIVFSTDVIACFPPEKLIFNHQHFKYKSKTISRQNGWLAQFQ